MFSQFLTYLPLIFGPLAKQESDAINKYGGAFIGKENTRVGSPLTPDEVAKFTDFMARFIVAEEKLGLAKATGTTL